MLLGLQRAFKEAGRVLHMSFESSRALLQHNPDGLDPCSLLNRDSCLLVEYPYNAGDSAGDGECLIL